MIVPFSCCGQWSLQKQTSWPQVTQLGSGQDLTQAPESSASLLYGWAFGKTDTAQSSNAKGELRTIQGNRIRDVLKRSKKPASIRGKILAKRRRGGEQRWQNTHIKDDKIKRKCVMFYSKCLKTKKLQNRTMSHSLKRQTTEAQGK